MFSTANQFRVYSNAHRGKKRKKESDTTDLPLLEEETLYVPSKGWTEIIKKVYEVDPFICPKCAGKTRIIAFIADYSAVDRNINHLKLTFAAALNAWHPVFSSVPSALKRDLKDTNLLRFPGSS